MKECDINSQIRKPKAVSDYKSIVIMSLQLADSGVRNLKNEALNMQKQLLPLIPKTLYKWKNEFKKHASMECCKTIAYSQVSLKE
ncbi:hypothetical protein HYE30_00885 [Mycoplasmopsis bovis]|nr:hypothetical protein [Mycoplasmopsis bovis]QQH22453.1 hypothetical protein HYE30_00885 [Mycoplasmopsis bovis]